MYTVGQRRSIGIAIVLLGVIPVPLVLFSETMQHVENLGIYWWIYMNMGHVWADICLGQLGDLMAPLGVSGIFMILVLGMGRLFKINVYSDAILIVKIMALLTGTGFLLGEVVSTVVGTEICSTQNDICKGEFRDMLCFSVPLIAHGFWRIIRHFRLKHEA